jgi:hypothetical protein
MPEVRPRIKVRPNSAKRPRTLNTAVHAVLSYLPLIAQGPEACPAPIQQNVVRNMAQVVETQPRGLRGIRRPSRSRYRGKITGTPGGKDFVHTFQRHFRFLVALPTSEDLFLSAKNLPFAAKIAAIPEPLVDLDRFSPSQQRRERHYLCYGALLSTSKQVLSEVTRLPP